MQSRCAWLVSVVLIATLSQSSARSAESNARPEIKSALFELRNVRLLDGPFGQQQEMNRKYLLKLEPDRLLSWFRREAGLEPKAPPYRGWESEPPTLPGHILGFYMSGAAMMYQATGDTNLRQRLDYIIDQLDEVQNANDSGYLLPVAGGKKLFEEIAAGNFRIGGSATYGYQINGLFEPTYTWNKITLGIYEVYRATGNEKAKRVLVRTADWLGHDVLDKLSDEQVQTLLNCEHGSIHESFVDVYLLTSDEKYLKWARRLCHDRMLNPLAEDRGDFLNGYHANCSIPIYTGFERVYDCNGETRLHTAAVNFWEEVVNRRSWVIGGNSAGEHFFDPKTFERALHAPAGPESCNSVNMLRLTEALYRTRPTPAMLDYYECTLWNHLLAVHEPERGMFAYYCAMQPGAYRVYSDEFDSMWCCVGTGLECPGKYGQMIYTRAPDNSALDVNLFIASELKWPEKNLTIRQETRFPEEPSTTLKIIEAPTSSASFTLRIRHPRWIPAGELTISVNGTAIDSKSKPGEFAEINREWRNGDKVQVALPLHLTEKALPNSERYVAFLYGPIVLSGKLGTEGLSKFDFWQLSATTGRKTMPESSFPALVSKADEDLLAHIKPVAGKPLTFRTEGGLMRPAEVEMIPFYQNFYQRYAIYWRRYTPEEYQAQQRELAVAGQRARELDAVSLDHVKIGDADSEAAHHFRGQRTNTGEGAYNQHLETHWRDTTDWFSYELKVSPEKPVTLACTYWGQETGARTFDVLVNDHIIATTSLKDTGKAEFYTVETLIPQELTRGKGSVVVRFQAHTGNTAGGLFDLRSISK